MKKTIALLMLSAALSACAASKKDLRAMDSLLEKSKTVDCDTIRYYLDQVQKAIQDKLK